LDEELSKSANTERPAGHEGSSLWLDTGVFYQGKRVLANALDGTMVRECDNGKKVGVTEAIQDLVTDILILSDHVKAMPKEVLDRHVAHNRARGN
jgi:hypothetical protein